jgi:glycine/D-amino acid oxidase-like deaminating enzyme
MTVTADAVVIGGGVMGTSILYNLVSSGVRNPVLLERTLVRRHPYALLHRSERRLGVGIVEDLRELR